MIKSYKTILILTLPFLLFVSPIVAQETRSISDPSQLADITKSRRTKTQLSIAPTPTIPNSRLLPGTVFYDFETETSGATGTFANGWVGAPTTNYRWQADAGGTGSPGTGPDFDHTLGTAAGIYMYVEASSPAVAGDIATLESPYIVIDTFSIPVVSFWVHRAGTSMGDMITAVFDGSVWVDLDTMVGSQQSATTDPWIERKLSLASITADSIKIKFTGICGASWSGDMAVDDVGVKNGVAFDATLTGAGTNYTIFPETQQNVDFKGTVNNEGVSTLTGVTLKATVGAWADSSSTPTLAAGASTTLNITTAPIFSVGMHNGLLETFANEVDADPSNNTDSVGFEISDSVFARDDGIASGALGIGAGTAGTIGQTFEVMASDTITSATFWLNGPTVGDVVDVTLYTFGTTPGTILGTTNSLTVTSGTGAWYTLKFPTPQVVAPGTYFLGVNEGIPNNVSLGTTGFNFQPNTGWVIFGANPWLPSESYNFFVTYLLRANFGTPGAAGPPPTGNDNICSAVPTVLDTIYPGDNLGMTTEPGESPGSCWTDGPSLDNTVWYNFVAPFSAIYRTSTDFLGGTNTDTQLAAYLSSGGCSGTLTEIGCDDDGGTVVVFNSIMDFSAIAGDTVWIQVDGWNNPPAAQGTFSIQTTLLQLADSFDASLDNAVAEATGIGGYTLIPSSQYNSGDVGFFLNVDNIGTDAVTGVAVNGTVTPGASNVTGSVPTIAGFGSEVVSTNSFTATNTTSYTANFSVSINENDGDPTNNNAVSTFTSGTLSDSIMARENEIASTAALGYNAGTGSLADTYRFTNADTISSITVFFGGDPAGKTFELFIADYSDGIGATELWNSGPLTGIAGANAFFTFGTGDVAVTPSIYMIGVHQTDVGNNIALGLTTAEFRPGTTFTGSLGNFSPIEAIGNPAFDGSFMIRPNVKFNINVTLADYNLLTPTDGSVVSVSGSSTTPIVMDWEDAVASPSVPVSYNFMMDTAGGNFSTPILQSASDNSGADSKLTLTVGQLETLLSILGYNVGDTLNAIWQVEATAGSVTKMALSQFDVSFDFGIVGIDKALLDKSINMYPNPADGLLTIEVENDLVNTVSILNSIGQTVKSNVWSGGSKKVYDISDLASGIYFVNFQTENGTYSRKLIVR